MAACPSCGAERGASACPRCGEAAATAPMLHGVRFRAIRRVARPPQTARPTPRPRRRGGGLALTLAFLLIAGGLATASYVLLGGPGAADSFLSLADQLANGGGSATPSDPQAPVAVDGVYRLRFSWSFQGTPYTWQMNVTEATYEHFRGLERPVRRYLDGGVWHVQPAYDIYVSNAEDDLFIDALARVLRDRTRQEGFTEYESLSFVLSFVQSLPYTRDDVTTGFDEYPRYPIETLVDGGGDCEDTSVLFASLVHAMGFGAIMVSPPGHMAVGVAAAEGVGGASYTFRDQRYVYAETTGGDYGIGEIPREYASSAVSVYDLSPKPLFALHVEFGDVTRDGRQRVLMRAVQTGSASAAGVQLVASVGPGPGQSYDERSCSLGDVPPGATRECEVFLDLNRVPRGTRVAIRALVQDTQFIYDEVESATWTPRV